MSTSSFLQMIESKAAWLRRDTSSLISVIQHLPARRSFETRAEEGLAVAEHELISALAKVRNARAAYAALPVDDKVA